MSTDRSRHTAPLVAVTHREQLTRYGFGSGHPFDDDRLAIFWSAVRRRGLDKVLQECGLGPHFHASRCADEAFSKPHPQMLEEILTDLDTPPHRALVVGDTEYDMRMAVNAGSHGLGVNYGVHEPQRLLESGALATLEAFTELMGQLRRIAVAVDRYVAEAPAGIDEELSELEALA